MSFHSWKYIVHDVENYFLCRMSLVWFWVGHLLRIAWEMFNVKCMFLLHTQDMFFIYQYWINVWSLTWLVRSLKLSPSQDDLIFLLRRVISVTSRLKFAILESSLNQFPDMDKVVQGIKTRPCQCWMFMFFTLGGGGHSEWTNLRPV